MCSSAPRRSFGRVALDCTGWLRCPSTHNCECTVVLHSCPCHRAATSSGSPGAASRPQPCTPSHPPCRPGPVPSTAQAETRGVRSVSARLADSWPRAVADCTARARTSMPKVVQVTTLPSVFSKDAHEMPLALRRVTSTFTDSTLNLLSSGLMGWKSSYRFSKTPLPSCTRRTLIYSRRTPAGGVPMHAVELVRARACGCCGVHAARTAVSSKVMDDLSLSTFFAKMDAITCVGVWYQSRRQSTRFSWSGLAWRARPPLPPACRTRCKHLSTC